MGNGIKLFLSAFFSFSALILAIVACAGSTRNYVPINRIFAAQVDISALNRYVTFPQSDEAWQSSSDGLPSYINIGLWSYCVTDSDKNVERCTSPRAIQQFNLRSFLYDNIEDDELGEAGSSSDISISQFLENNRHFYDALLKCMFITLLIGICLTFLHFIVNILRWLIHARLLNFIGGILAFFAFISLLVSAATGTASLVYLKREYFDKDDTWGVGLSLGRNFWAILWASVVSSLLCFILWCMVRSKRRVTYVSQAPIEEKPLI